MTLSKSQYLNFTAICEQADGYALGEEVEFLHLYIEGGEPSWIPATVKGRTGMGHPIVEFADYAMRDSGKRQIRVVEISEAIRKMKKEMKDE